MRTGRVKWYDAFQNYGYIVLVDGSEVYFHSTGLLNLGSAEQLNPGTDVVFDLIETRAGPEAHNVDLVA